MIDKKRLQEKLDLVEDDLFEAVIELPYVTYENDLLGQLRLANAAVLRASNKLTALLIDLEP